MPIPDFQTIMLPMLEYLGDGKTRTISDLYDHLSTHFKLSEIEKKELLPSGKQPIFNNRVGWARTYMKKAGLLDSPRRGEVKITKVGRDLLLTKPQKISVKTLDKYPGFTEYHRQKKEKELPPEKGPDKRTPEEILASSYTVLRETLEDELLTKVLSKKYDFFERMVVELLVKMGYGGSIPEAGKAIGKSGDGGLDGVIKEDRLGLDEIYVQAKSWAVDNIVGRPDVQRFIGALSGPRAKKGIFITTSDFSKEAREFAKQNQTRVVLINGKELVKLMFDHNVGVTTSNVYEVKQIDFDFFDQGD
jgi:restriction system protein